MSLTVSSLGSSALEIGIHGRLDKRDYERLVPAVEQRLDGRSKLALLVHVSELGGWTPAGLWEDLKFDAKHYRDISRLAIVANDQSKRWYATLSKPFTTAEIRFFTESELADARAWVKGQAQAGASARSAM